MGDMDMLSSNKWKELEEIFENTYKKRLFFHKNISLNEKIKKTRRRKTSKKSLKNYNIALPIIIGTILVDITQKGLVEYIGSDFLYFTNITKRRDKAVEIIRKNKSWVLDDVKKYNHLLTDFRILLNKKNLVTQELYQFLKPYYLDYRTLNDT